AGNRVWSRMRRRPRASPASSASETHSTALTPAMNLLPRAGPPVEHPQGGVVDQAVTDHHVGPVDARRVVPGREASAGLLDDRLECGHVPGVDCALDHQLAGALGDQDEAVEVAEAALDAGRPANGLEAVEDAGLPEPVQAAVEDQRLGQVG